MQGPRTAASVAVMAPPETLLQIMARDSGGPGTLGWAEGLRTQNPNL